MPAIGHAGPKRLSIISADVCKSVLRLSTTFAIYGFVSCLFTNAVQAQQPSALDRDFDERPWEEQKQKLPGYPNDTNLKQIEIGPLTSFRFFVDTQSVNVGADGVVRFTLVARSDRGATNISFEGLRCKTQEKKLYAVGRSDGTWIPASNAAWTILGRQNVNPAQSVLYEDFFCPEGIVVSSTSEAIDALNNGGHQRARTRR